MGITGQKNLLFEVSNLEYPKVSVVIPVYNAEEYLNRCIASLTSQTYQNMEYLFVDDGSNDCSPALLEAAAKSDDRILFFSQKNAGPSAARNLGMDHATGKYLLFCDSDDTVSPTWCERLVRAIQEHPTSWIVCGIQTIDETGHELYVTQPPSPQQLLEKSAYFSLFKRGYSGSVYNKIFNLELLRKAHIRFDESRKRGEDVIFCIEYFMQTENIVVIDALLYQYYRYETSETLTNRWHGDDYKDLCDLYSWRKKIITSDCMDAFRSHYWYLFLTALNDTMQSDHAQRFTERMRLNHTIVSQAEFQELLLYCGKSDLHPLAFWFLRRKCYSGYYLLQSLHSEKQRIRNRK